jgi:hypothetical protein
VRDIHRGTTKNEFKEIFTITQRQKDGQFDYGNPMPDPFNKSKNEGSPTITVDNRYLVFTKCMDVIVSNNLTYYNCDLYYSEFIDGEWTPIASLGRNINREDTWESQASISPDGQTIFFLSSDRPEETRYDIISLHATKTAIGDWPKMQERSSIPIKMKKLPSCTATAKPCIFPLPVIEVWEVMTFLCRVCRTRVGGKNL